MLCSLPPDQFITQQMSRKKTRQDGPFADCDFCEKQYRFQCSFILGSIFTSNHRLLTTSFAKNARKGLEHCGGIPKIRKHFIAFQITTRASFVINNIVKSLVLNKLDPVCENFSRSSGSPYINIFQSFRCRVLQLYLAKINLYHKAHI